MTKPRTWTEDRVITAAVEGLTSPVLLAAIVAAIPNYKDLADIINATITKERLDKESSPPDNPGHDQSDDDQPGERAAVLVWDKGSVEQACRTARDHVLADGDGDGSPVQPREWLAQRVAAHVALFDIDLKTGAAARAPLKSLLDRRPPPTDWVDDIEDTARRIFMRALRRTDGKLDRIDMLPLRFLGEWKREDLWTLPNGDQIRAQRDSYEDLWVDLLAHYGLEVPNGGSRGSKRNPNVTLMLEDLSALEDGFLERAAHTSTNRQRRFSRRFAPAARVLIENLTQEILAH